MPAPKNKEKYDEWVRNLSISHKGQHSSPKTQFKKGEHPSINTEFKKGEMAGEKNNNWNGGIIFSENRCSIYKPDHPYCRKRDKYIFRSRLVMEKMIGRYLKPLEVVHHIDTDTLNDDPSNLMLFPNQNAHTKYHWTTENKIASFRECRSIQRKGIKNLENGSKKGGRI